jgi:hypothetical protein
MFAPVCWLVLHFVLLLIAVMVPSKWLALEACVLAMVSLCASLDPPIRPK